MGGNGAYLELDGFRTKRFYVVEIPPARRAQSGKAYVRRMYYVVEGRRLYRNMARRGTREEAVVRMAEGQSLLAAAQHLAPPGQRHIESGALVVGTNAPPIMAMFKSRKFIFDNPFQFDDRYPNDDDYFRPAEELSIRPENGRHINLGNLIPDTLNCELPLENHRGAGHRNFAWRLSGNCFIGFVAQYPPGRYSKAHFTRGDPRWSVCAARGI